MHLPPAQRPTLAAQEADAGVATAAPCPTPTTSFLLLLLLQENKLGQKFVVDATLLADLSHAGRTDDLQRTINYARVYE